MTAPQTLGLAPLEHTGDSANIAYYAERNRAGRKRYIFCEVLRGDHVFRPGLPAKRARVPKFHITVYELGTGEIGRFSYTPRQKPPAGPLAARTVTRLVRNWAEGKRPTYVKRWRFDPCEAGPRNCPHQPRCGLERVGHKRERQFGHTRVGWVGPITGAAQARRKVDAWQAAGWRAQAYPSTPEIKRTVRVWEQAAKARREVA